MQVIHESPHLVRLMRCQLVNCFLLKDDDGCTLIDTNLPGSAPHILRASQALGWPIRRIVLTHAHFDHVASLDSLAAALPGIPISIGARESRFLRGDFSLDAGECPKRPLALLPVKTPVTQTLLHGDQLASLRAIASPGHTPGHFSYLDVRDNTLIAGDAFANHLGLTAAGVFRWTFPLASIFSWDRELSAKSAVQLRNLYPARLAMGHGETLVSPAPQLDRATALAIRQYPSARTP